MTYHEKAEKSKIELATEDTSKLPSFFTQARNIAKQAWISGTGVLEGKPFLTTADIAKRRFDICTGCEFLRDNRCLKCGCYMLAKVQLELAKCPANKWDVDLQIQTDTPVERNNMIINIEKYPEEERKEILKLAIDSLNYDGRFAFKGIQFKTVKKPNQDVVISTFSPTRNILNSLTEEEKVEFNRLADESKVNGTLKFMFKGYQWNVTRKENGNWKITQNTSFTSNGS